MSKIKGKNNRATLATKLIAGIKEHYPKPSTSLAYGGTSVTVGALTTAFQALVSNRSAVVAAQATAKVKVGAENAQIPATNDMMDAFVQYIRTIFGEQADTLADFGLAPPKARTPMTAEAKAVAVVRREATRTARGTMGPKAKRAVKGAIDASLVVTPATAPAPEDSATATAASAPSGVTTPKS